MIKVLVVTHSPSPYQVEFFDAVAKCPDIALRAVYLYAADPTRSWSRRTPNHEYLMLEGNQAAGQIKTWEGDADLLVVNYYRHPSAAKVISMRVGRGIPWVFWGERPGYSGPIIGRLARLWTLRALRRSRAPIWGIGSFGVNGYKQEFGTRRPYANVPYFSDLGRFASSRSVAGSNGARRTILFSGSLTRRKGVDLLAQAFVRVARSRPALRLQLLGTGNMRTDLERFLAPVAAQVEFLGFKDWDELPSVYAGADLLCVPSRYDGWGLVVAEGLAAGLPVIATDRMGAAIDLVRSGENGWLIPANDGATLLRTLEDAARLPQEKLNAMSRTASGAIELHSLEHGAARFVAACRSAIDEWTE